ncbi:hypothetical protein GSI_00550 [Ganoderma sinense ZZ0214-1]|uniref:Uncharacterized protein n=1 Tax=Ganoderma sinense ZZ0214-1 TaxID=1077348 RepID=A0A2G8SSW8_9APHY|nr:hypothetical protein GSI_00550 [Ganoderma sinense ZZ0214-1]
MPLFGKSKYSENAEIREVEKRVAKEARTDQKSLDSAISDFSKAEDAHTKSIKAIDDARHALDKAVKKEHQAALALDDAKHKHDVAVTEGHNAEKTMQMKQDHANRLEQGLDQKRQRLEDMREQKSHKDHQRESQLSEMHAREAAAAEARASISEPQSPTTATIGDKGTAQAPATAPSGVKA